MKEKNLTIIIAALLTTSVAVNSVFGQTGLLSDASTLVDNGLLISTIPAEIDKEELSILSSPTITYEDDDVADAGLLSDPNFNLVKEQDDFDYDFDFDNLNQDIIETLDISIVSAITDSKAIQPMSYTYRTGMDETYIKLNNDAASIINRYMEKAQYIPVRDPLWFLAIGAIEYNYRENESDIIFSWPVDTNEARNNSEYLLQYNWKEVQRIGGDNLVTRRTGGAIGAFQLESFFGYGTEPLIPDDFGLIGSMDGQMRTDCWTELGGSPGQGTNIIWKQGTYSDRWSIADVANQTLAVYNETIRRSGTTELDNLIDRYGKVTLLMWAHNRGTGLLGQTSARESVERILAYKDELEQLVCQYRPNRFARQNYFMSKVREICEIVGCDEYPVMSLISYIVIEKRYSGCW